jgi:hypothetical protein
MGRQKRQRIVEILDLLETDDAAEFALRTRVGCKTLELSEFEPKPCRTKKAARRSPARNVSGTPITPCSRKPAD